jgi:hypothetical protein
MAFVLIVCGVLVKSHAIELVMQQFDCRVARRRPCSGVVSDPV